MFDVELESPAGVMRIAGNSFITRPAERCCKKIKSFMEFVGSAVYKSKLNLNFTGKGKKSSKKSK